MDDQKKFCSAPWLCALASGVLGPIAAACTVLFFITESHLFLMVLVVALMLLIAVHYWKDRVTEGLEISLPAQIFSFFFPILTSVPVSFLCLMLFGAGVML